MPTIHKVIKEFFPEDSIVLARIARFSPGGRLWEHVDYTELNDTPRSRFHIPIATEREAVLVTAGYRVHMAAGHLWVFNPRDAHGIAHDGQQDRIHLIVDVTVDDRLAITPPRLDATFVERLQGLSPPEAERCMHALARFAMAGDSQTTINEGLDLFYRFKLPAGLTTHRMIATAFALAGDDAKYQEWLEKESLYMQGGYKHD